MGFFPANFQLPMSFYSRLRVRNRDRQPDRQTDRQQLSTLNAPMYGERGIISFTSTAHSRLKSLQAASHSVDAVYIAMLCRCQTEDSDDCY